MLVTVWFPLRGEFIKIIFGKVLNSCHVRHHLDEKGKINIYFVFSHKENKDKMNTVYLLRLYPLLHQKYLLNQRDHLCQACINKSTIKHSQLN